MILNKKIQKITKEQNVLILFFPLKIQLIFQNANKINKFSFKNIVFYPYYF